MGLSNMYYFRVENNLKKTNNKRGKILLLQLAPNPKSPSLLSSVGIVIIVVAALPYSFFRRECLERIVEDVREPALSSCLR